MRQLSLHCVFDCDLMGARSRSVGPAMCITQRSMIDIIKLGGPGDRLSDDLSVDCAGYPACLHNIYQIHYQKFKIYSLRT